MEAALHLLKNKKHWQARTCKAMVLHDNEELPQTPMIDGIEYTFIKLEDMNSGNCYAADVIIDDCRTTHMSVVLGKALNCLGDGKFYMKAHFSQNDVTFIQNELIQTQILVLLQPPHFKTEKDIITLVRNLSYLPGCICIERWEQRNYYITNADLNA